MPVAGVICIRSSYITPLRNIRNVKIVALFPNSMSHSDGELLEVIMEQYISRTLSGFVARSSYARVHVKCVTSARHVLTAAAN